MNKKLRKSLSCCLLLVMAYILLFPVHSQAAQKLNSTSVSLVVGNTKQLKLQNKTGKITWKSSKSSVAKVSANGLVTARKKGSAVITASVSGKKYSCSVSVKDAKLNQSSLSLEIGEKYTLKLTNSKGTASWSSADKSVADVSSSGVVTGIGQGSTQIKVKVASSTYLCQVEVSDSDAPASVSTDFAGGNGSKENPYQVASYEQLKAVGRHNDCCFIQTADIDAGYETLVAMFDSEHPFTGTYDGNGKTISNLLLKNTTEGDKAAIFQSIGEEGTLKNLTMVKCQASLTTEEPITIYGACLAAENAGKIESCTLEECTVVASTLQVYAKGPYGYGGIVCAVQKGTGAVTGCTVRNCKVNAAGNSTHSYGYAGGIVAVNEGKIVNSKVTGLTADVSCSLNKAMAGGVAAINESGGVIINVDVTGTLSCSARKDKSYAGGIAAENKGQITGWTADVSLNADHADAGSASGSGVVSK